MIINIFINIITLGLRHFSITVQGASKFFFGIIELYFAQNRLFYNRQMNDE